MTGGLAFLTTRTLGNASPRVGPAGSSSARRHDSALAVENWHRRQFVNLALALEIEPRPAERIAGEHQHARDTALG